MAVKAIHRPCLPSKPKHLYRPVRCMFWRKTHNAFIACSTNTRRL